MNPLYILLWIEVAVIVGLLIWVLYPTRKRRETFKENYVKQYKYVDGDVCWWCNKVFSEGFTPLTHKNFSYGWILTKEVRLCSEECGLDMIDAA